MAEQNYPGESFGEDPELLNLRLPPHSIEAEQAVLGGLILNNAAWDTVSEQVVTDNFYRRDHRLIFVQIAKLAEAGGPVDVVTLGESLNQEGVLEEAGGMAYLYELEQNTPSASNIRAYANVVRERATLRNLIQTAQDIADSGFNPQGRESAELIDEAERRIMAVSERVPKVGGPQPVEPLLSEVVEHIAELSESDSEITGLSTGFLELDRMTSGLQRADMIVVAGRPGMGKTSLAMNLVEHAVLQMGKTVLVFSMEMSATQLILRLLASVGRIDQTRIRSGQLDHDDWARLSTAMERLKDGRLYIDDTAALNPTEVRSRARRLVREHGELGLIMVDYLQLMRVSGNSEGRVAEISEISRNLKAIAKEFDCPVLAVAQLNRALEQRVDRRPVNSDLRDSGAIEQDADVIMFIYREEFYNEDSPEKGVAEIIFGKQRNGPTGKKRLAFNGKYTRFDNLAPEAAAG